MRFYLVKHFFNNFDKPKLELNDLFLLNIVNLGKILMVAQGRIRQVFIDSFIDLKTFLVYLSNIFQML